MKKLGIYKFDLMNFYLSNKEKIGRKFVLLDSGDDMSVDTVDSSDDDPNSPAVSRLIRRL